MTEIIQAIDNSFETESTQMAFSIADSRSLGLLVDKPADQVCDFLAHHIAREPQDLMVHVQRIKLAAKHELKPVLKGALLDLYIALGVHGYELRKCMLKLASDILPGESIQHLANGLDDGIGASDAISDSGISVLCKNIAGNTELIQMDSIVQQALHDPLEQALVNIECSQLDEACEVLEEAIHAGTSSAEQQALLLDLYQKTNDKTRFAQIYPDIVNTGMQDQAAWRTLANHFSLDH